MKILFVIGNLDVGGAQKNTVEMLNCLGGKYDIDLLVLNRYLMPLKQEIKGDVRFLSVQGEGKYFFERLRQSVRDLMKRRDFGLLLSRLTVPCRIRISKSRKYPEQVIWESVKKNIEEMEEVYDIAIACCQGLSTYYVIDKVKARKKIAWMHSDAECQVHDRKYTLRYYEKYDRINTVSYKGAEALERIYPEVSGRISVFHNIINARSIVEKSRLYSPGYDPARVNLCTVGRLSMEKGYYLAIEVCRKLRDKGYDICWYALGEGSLRTDLKKAVSEYHLDDSFILAGVKENPFPYMRECSIYVQTSLWEGYCRTLEEARILGKPIVTTDFTGAAEQIKNGKSGIICGKNADEICSGISFLIDNPEKGEEFSEYLKKEEHTDDGFGRFDNMVKQVFSGT